jgi:cell wall-associated NlpC family hydrolase
MFCAGLLTGCAGETINIADSDFTPPVTTTPADDGIPDDTPPATSPPVTDNPDDNTPERVERPGTEPFLPETPGDDITDDIPPSTTDGDNSIVQTARSLIGIEFASGGSSPAEGFDNSGFIYYVLRENGYVNCPRGLQEQAVMGNRVSSLNELRPGDLVFFSESGDRAQFGGIYAGNGVMVSCRMQGETVNEFNIMTNYYIDNFFVGVRVL